MLAILFVLQYHSINCVHALNPFSNPWLWFINIIETIYPGCKKRCGDGGCDKNICIAPIHYDPAFVKQQKGIIQWSSDHYKSVGFELKKGIIQWSFFAAAGIYIKQNTFDDFLLPENDLVAQGALFIVLENQQIPASNLCRLSVCLQ